MAPRSIMVTGANRSIGFCIVHRLAKRAPENTYLLAVRSAKAGVGAVQQLRELGLTSVFQVVEMDVTKDGDVQRVTTAIEKSIGKLDVLINNAAIAAIPTPETSLPELRAMYNRIFDTNITSVATVTTALMPLLRRSDDPRVINVSSGRASMHALTTGAMPPTASVAYSVSKTALNVLMLEMAKQEAKIEEGDRILYQAANPGHCKTAFNGFRGQRDPLEGAKVFEELVCSERGTWDSGFWEWEGDEESGKMKTVPW